MAHTGLAVSVAHLRLLGLPRSQEPDADLLRRFARQGDAAAFEQLVERHAGLVWGVCRRVLPGEADCEDAFQATFLALVRQAASLDPRRPLGAWLHTVAVRAARKANARSLRQPAAVTADRPTPGDVADAVGGRELLRAVDEEINRLPAALRGPVVLCCLEGRTRDEAAEALGCSVAAVKSRLERGRVRLRRQLRRRGIELPAAFLVLTLTGGRVRAALRGKAVQSALGAAPPAIAALVPAAAAPLASRLAVAALSLIVAGTIGLGSFAGADPAQDAGRNADAPPAVAARRAEPEPPPDPTRAVVEGIVVDEAAKPVAGAEVRVPGHAIATATTAADGRFRVILDGPLARYTTIHVRGSDGAKMAVARTDPFDDDAVVRARIVLKRAATIRVQVVNGENTPVADAAVTAQGPAGTLAHCRTDAAGAAELRVPADADVQQVIGLKSGAGLDYLENYRALPAVERFPPPAQVRLVLDGAQSVSIKAADPAGKPVAGAEVVPIVVWKRGKLSSVNWDGGYWLGPDRAVTDAQGAATCAWVPAALQRSACFNLIAPGYRCVNVPYFHLNGKVEPGVAPLLPGVDVVGKVLRPDGGPAAGVLIEADGRHVGVVGGTPAGGISVARTTADGSYRMSLQPGSGYLVTALDAEWAASRTSAAVHPKGPNPDFDLRLRPGTLVAGRVTAGPGDRPAAGETMYLKQLGPPLPGKDAAARPWLIRWARTDDDGRYRFRVGPGEYQIAGPDMKFADLTVGNEAMITRDFRLPRLPRGPFELTIRKPDGSPAAGALVPWIGLQQVRADDRGRVQTVRNREPMLAYAHDSAANLAGFTVIGADDEAASVALKSAATATGRVVGTDGRPRMNCTVTAVVRSPAHQDQMLYVILSTYSGPGGLFSLPGLAEGTTCSIIVCNGMTCGIKPAKEFAVTGPGPISLGDVAAPPDRP
jgi:RNA polymerase sigma factor (sigma-70 family)